MLVTSGDVSITHSVLSVLENKQIVGYGRVQFILFNMFLESMLLQCLPTALCKSACLSLLGM